MYWNPFIKIKIDMSITALDVVFNYNNAISHMLTGNDVSLLK